jgi:hypothetical protein
MPADFYDGNASQVDFTVTFDYTDQSFVVVSVDDITLTQGIDYSFFTATTIRFTAAPAVGADNIEFDRQTSTTLLIDFTAGASILDTDLDTAIEQILHIAEERLTEADVNALIAASLLDPTTVISTYMGGVVAKETAVAAQAELGFEAKARTLVALLTNTAWLDELGMDGTGMQTFLWSDDLATARTNLGVTAASATSLQNEMLNSDFQVWQALGATVGSGDNNNLAYFADQWKLISDGNDIVDIAQVNASLPAGAKSSVSFTTQQATIDQWGFYQLLENTRSKGIAGQSVSASIKMKRGASDTLTLMRLHIFGWSGAADAPTADPVSAYGATTDDPTFVADFASIDSVDIVLTDDWQTFSLENIAVGSGVENVGILVTTIDGAFAAGDVVHATGVKLELNDTATTYQSPSFLQELAECERFYAKTFEYDVVPAENTNDYNGTLRARAFNNAAVTTLEAYWTFNSLMHSAPTMVTFNWGSTGTGWRSAGDTLDLAIATEQADKRSYSVSSADGGAISAHYGLHATANARFF